MADGQGGFHSHLANPVGSEVNSSTSSDDVAKLADHFSEIQLSNLLEKQPSDCDAIINDQRDSESETLFDLEKASDNLLTANATEPWEAPIYDEYPDNELISVIGQYLDLTIASISQARFVYWKGMKPSKLLKRNERLVAYIPELPYQEGSHLSLILEEGTGDTEPATYYSNESCTDRHVYMADIADSHRDHELPEDISADDLTADAGNEDDTQWEARREKNRQRQQRRTDAQQRQRIQRNLQTEFERAAEQGFHTPMANAMHATRLLDRIQDPAVRQSVRLLQLVAIRLNERDKMASLSRSRD